MQQVYNKFIRLYNKYSIIIVEAKAWFNEKNATLNIKTGRRFKY